VNHTVLYIEDNEDNIRLVERLVARRPDIQLQVATNAGDGITAATSGHPGLILLDNRLPDATGAEVLGRLAADQATAAIPVIILTGDSSPATASELLTAGAAEFLAKPFDIHQLMTLIDRYLSGTPPTGTAGADASQPPH
jgi:CheY-like chemotaxis protein